MAKVKEDGKTNMSYKYVAVCHGELDENGEVEVMFLRSTGNNKCFKTVEEDVAFVHYTDIVCILPPPNLQVSGGRISYKFDELIKVVEKPYT